MVTLEYPFITKEVIDGLNLLNKHYEYIKTSVFSIPFVKPINKAQISDIAKKYNNIIILEEHHKSCGVGSAIVEILNDLFFEDTFYGVSGSQSYLREKASLVLKREYFNNL